jgi:hypothetical protein
MKYRTCTFIRDDGTICNAAAVTAHSLCRYHLRHRARLMRMAQYRARQVAKDATALNGSFRSPKPCASIGIGPQRERPLVTKVQVPVLS